MLPSRFRFVSFRSIVAGKSGPYPIPLVLLLAACVFTCSCCDDDDNDKSSETENNSITIKEDHDWSFDVNDYTWDSPGTTARINLEIDDFHHGDMLVTIFDSKGETIFSKLYWSFDWYWYIDGEFTDIDFTDSGEPGQWTIVLEFDEFTGDVKLIVESTDAPPTEPDVPDPDEDSNLLDLTFGKDGRAAYEPENSGGRRVAVDSAGRILVCGTLVTDQGERRLTVWRFTSTGILDSSFGDGGLKSYTDPGVFASGALDMTIDISNRIIVTGWVAPLVDRKTNLALLRFTPSGNIDTGFATNGIFTFDDGQDETGVGVAIDSLAKIVVAGTSRISANPAGHVLILRFSASGVPDTAWDGDGVLSTPEGNDKATDIAIATGNDPLILGTRNGNFILWKYTNSGVLDGTFGTGGEVTSIVVPGEFRVGTSVAVKDDGTIGVTGVRYFSDGSTPPAMVIWRFLSDGMPLALFGGSGFLTFQYPNGWAVGTGILFDSNGRILVSGVTRTFSTSTADASATLWRYFAAGSIDTSLPGSNGAGFARFDPRPDNAGSTASSITFVGDGSVLASGSVFSRETNAVDMVVWKLKP